MSPRPTSPRHAIDISEADGLRYLHFGSEWVQGAMRIARPWSLVLDYTQDMMLGLLLREASDWPRSALLIGLGAGSTAKFLYRHFPDCRITVAEINPQVVHVAQQYFRVPDDPRLSIKVACGAATLLETRSTYDLIICDGFDPQGRAGVLDTPAFYQLARSRLTDRGIFCTNLLRGKSFAGSVERIHSAFSGHGRSLPPCASGNTILFARGDLPVDLPLPALNLRAEALRARTRLNLLPLLHRLEKAAVSGDAALRF